MEMGGSDGLSTTARNEVSGRKQDQSFAEDASETTPDTCWRTED